MVIGQAAPASSLVTCVTPTTSVLVPTITTVTSAVLVPSVSDAQFVRPVAC